ncbi:MAG TPA: hypothetical protein VM658_10595 [bacterium]|nr:hypothetical protein [bacterium]
MPKKRVELVTHIFKGARFEDHGIDIDVLEELIVYKKILVETAKELWRRHNPDRQRLPKNFEDSLCIKFYELREGSTGVPMMREIEYDNGELPLPRPEDELDEAVKVVAEAEDAANNDYPLPDNFPKNIIPLFDKYGDSLREDESFEHQPANSERRIIYNKKTRERLHSWSDGQYEDMIELSGEVRAADLDQGNFTIRLDDGTKVAGKFNPSQEEEVTLALREHEKKRLSVKGRGGFSSPEGKLRRIIAVEQMIIHQGNGDVFDASARPIWEVVSEIGASVPEEEWAKVPTDLSKNLDHYLYGAPKDAK